MITNDSVYSIAKTLKTDDVVRVHSQYQTKEENFTCRIHSVQEDSNNTICITYVPCKLKDSVRCGHGCMFLVPSKNNPSPAWGWRSIEVVGTEKTSIPSYGHGWMVRHPGYDLLY